MKSEIFGIVAVILGYHGTMGFHGHQFPLLVLYCQPEYTGSSLLVMPSIVVEEKCYDVNSVFPGCDIGSVELGYGFCATLYRTTTCDDSQVHENVQWNTTWLNSIPNSYLNHLASLKIIKCSQQELATCTSSLEECQASVSTLTSWNAALAQQLANAQQAAADSEKKYAEMVTTTCGPYIKVNEYYVCENGNVNVQCAQGQLISVKDANYGRLDATHCLTGSASNTKCTASNSMSITSENCNQKNSCSFTANNVVFGDPCPGTSKYFIMHYTCLPSDVYNSCSTI